MSALHRFLVAGLLTGLSLVYASTVSAQQPYQGQQPPLPKSYNDKVGDKALNGVTNIATSWLEVPKSIINDTNANDSNIFYGIVGGSLEGILQMSGRAASGVADLITAPLPTKPILSPRYIWEDFDETTRYGDAFRLDENAKPVSSAPKY